MDLIDRHVAIDTILSLTNFSTVRELYEYIQEHQLTNFWTGGINDAIDAVIGVPSAQPGCDEWCTDCKEYNKEKHSCPRWNRVIRQTVEDLKKQKTGRWIDDGQYAEGHPHHEWHCSMCGMSTIEVGSPWFKFCPECGAKMEGTKDETD